ncbi:hypothetical protein TNCV_2501021 [Trichonephila clavipes]|nr:hypothetical protein TNCV_2501021 [Trichonephila clavipes]
MIWPSRSTDMILIEHLWDIIQRSIRAHISESATIAQLWTALGVILLNNSAWDIQRLVESRPLGVVLLREKGGSTRY